MEDQKPTANESSADDVSKNKVNGVLAYLGLLILVPLLTARESEFASFHANQGLILILAQFAAGVFSIIPIIGWIGGPIIMLVLFVFNIMGIINAAKGEMKELPIIGHYKLLN